MITLLIIGMSFVCNSLYTMHNNDPMIKVLCHRKVKKQIPLSVIEKSAVLYSKYVQQKRRRYGHVPDSEICVKARLPWRLVRLYTIASSHQYVCDDIRVDYEFTEYFRSLNNKNRKKLINVAKTLESGELIARLLYQVCPDASYFVGSYLLSAASDCYAYSQIQSTINKQVFEKIDQVHCVPEGEDSSYWTQDCLRKTFGHIDWISLKKESTSVLKTISDKGENKIVSFLKNGKYVFASLDENTLFQRHFAARELGCYSPVACFAPNGMFFVVMNCADSNSLPSFAFYEALKGRFVFSLCLRSAPYNMIAISDDSRCISCISQRADHGLRAVQVPLYDEHAQAKVKKICTMNVCVIEAYALWRLYKAHMIKNHGITSELVNGILSKICTQ